MRTCWRGCTGWCLSAGTAAAAADCAVPAVAAAVATVAAAVADVAAVAVAAVAAAVGRMSVHNSCSCSPCSWSPRHCLVEGWIATGGDEAGS